MELLQFQNKALTGEELLLRDEQRKWILEMESSPGGDPMKTVDITKIQSMT